MSTCIRRAGYGCLAVVAWLVWASMTLGAGPVAPFAGHWTGHTRTLTITSAGIGKEVIDDGCCDRVMSFHMKLSKIHGTRAAASARVRIVSIPFIHKADFSPQFPAPKIGQTGTLRLRDGVITEPFFKTTFCSPDKQLTGACGA
jgi:hypothetical protein